MLNFFVNNVRKCGQLPLDSNNNSSSTSMGMWYGISYCSVKLAYLELNFLQVFLWMDFSKGSSCGRLSMLYTSLSLYPHFKSPP